MSEYQLEIKQVVDYPRCRIYRKFVQTLISDRSIRLGGSSGLFYYTVLCSYANFRTSYKRIDDISYTIYPGEWLCRVNELVEWFRTRFQHQTLSILQVLQERHLITYSLLGRGKLVMSRRRKAVRLRKIRLLPRASRTRNRRMRPKAAAPRAATEPGQLPVIQATMKTASRQRTSPPPRCRSFMRAGRTSTRDLK